MKHIKPILNSLFVAATALLLALIPVADGVPTVTCVQPPPDLVSWWPADGNSNDIVGSKNGTLQSGATFAAGQVGQAFSLDGVNDFVLVPNLDAPSLTFDAWIKRARTGALGNLDRLLVSVNNNGWGVYLTNDELRFGLVGVSEVASTGTIADTN